MISLILWENNRWGKANNWKLHMCDIIYVEVKKKSKENSALG